MTTSLSPQQIFSIKKRLPLFELSYETIAHKKVFDTYQLCLAIPTGKKSFAWFSFHNDQNVCFLMELNREMKISHITIADVAFDPSLSLGTILYGTVVTQEEKPLFVVEDIFYYQGIQMKHHTVSEKLGYLELFFSKYLLPHSPLPFFLPFLWGIKSPVDSDFKNRGVEERTQKGVAIRIKSEDDSLSQTSLLQEFETHRAQIPYPVHHLQVRKLTELSPYLNVQLYLRRFDVTSNVKTNARGGETPLLPRSLEKDLNKPQYRYPTVFMVSADIQYDIYHLYAFGESGSRGTRRPDSNKLERRTPVGNETNEFGANKTLVYYDIAYIQNIRVSKMMNSLFRNIRENENLDYIEESDDEEDFENIAADKYVDLQKKIPMEFVFQRKFKKWVPIRVVEPEAKIIYMNRL